MKKELTFGVCVLMTLALTASTYAAACDPGDGDGDIDLDEYVIWKNNVGGPGGCGSGDFNLDGIVDLFDFVVLERSFGGTEYLVTEPIAEEGWMFPIIDGSGRVSLVNCGSEPIVFDGYQLTASLGAFDVDAWYALSDRQSMIGPFWLEITADFEKANPGSSSLCEVAFGDTQTIQPGQSFDLGLIVPEGCGNLSLTWSNSEAPGSGVFVPVPEPASMSLLAFGGLALIRRKR